MHDEQQKSKVPAPVWVATLYTAMALPFCAVTAVSSYMYISYGLSAGQVAFLSGWLILPWTLKPFFSPFLEMWGRNKTWVMLTQMLMGAGFAVLAFTMPVPYMAQASLAVLMLIGFNSSVHDTAADGAYIDALDKAGQAKYVGFQSGFWTAGQLFAQGAMVGIAGQLEESWGIVPAWMSVWGLFAALMIVSAVWHRYCLPTGVEKQVEKGFAGVALKFREIGTDFFLKKHIWWLIAFAFIYRSAEGQVATVARLFMRAPLQEGGLGLSTLDVGILFGGVGTLGNVAGAFAGGWYASRVGLRKAIVPLALIFNIPNALFTYLAISQETNFVIVMMCSTVEKFALGMGFVAMTLVLMQQMAPGRYTTAHYGYATAMMGAGMMIPTQSAGYVSEALSFQGYFIYILIIGIPSILIAWFLPLQDDVKSVEIPEGAAGETIKSGGWATAKAAGSLYLVMVFSGMAYGDSVSISSAVSFTILAIIGVVMAVSAMRSAARTHALAHKVEGGVAHQAKLARIIALIAIVGWGLCVSVLAKRNNDLLDARTACDADSAIASCQVVCDNDNSFEPCEKVRVVRAADFAAKPGDEDIAKLALAAERKTSGIRCTQLEEIDACMSLAALQLDPGEWKTKAGAYANFEDVRRYYGKACLLGHEPACEAQKRARPAEEAAGVLNKAKDKLAKAKKAVEDSPNDAGAKADLAEAQARFDAAQAVLDEAVAAAKAAAVPPS